MYFRRRPVVSAVFGYLGPRRPPLLPSSSPQANLGIDGIAIISRRASLGSYEVTALIGSGGMGEVYRDKAPHAAYRQGRCRVCLTTYYE